jgi:UTP--glucose-1-phosphate uridylyltransferase|tara:strand:+ start:38 stop:1192 length:1155 start_codon:yes stop_codon:yes gene_type:complete
MVNSLSIADLTAKYDIDVATASILNEYLFDPGIFDLHMHRIKLNGFDQAKNHLKRTTSVPEKKDLEQMPSRDSDEYARLKKIGEEAFLNGEVLVVVLAGGMATRFGGGIKALAPILEGLSFARVKQLDLENYALKHNVTCKLLFMTSFLSDESMSRWAALNSNDHVKIATCPQSISLRLRKDGQIFREDNGGVSFYSPGHGDLLEVLSRSEDFEQFYEGGGKYVLVNNVDNAAATFDPAVLGAHISIGKQMTCEIARNDSYGGAPRIVGGRLEIIEDFCLSTRDKIETNPFLNTNTLVINAEIFKTPVSLNYFDVEKNVNGIPLIQFELLIGELSRFVEATMLLVEAEGLSSRFEPMKSLSDIEQRRESVLRILEDREIFDAGH